MTDKLEPAQVEANAVADKYKAERMRSQGKAIAPMPFGRQVDATNFISMAYDLQQNWWLDKPEKIIQHPEAGFHYAWPKLDDPGTRAKIRAGKYVLVRMKEVDPHTSAEIETHKGTDYNEKDPGSALVKWYGHVLVKISEKAYKELYEAPVARAVSRVAGRDNSFSENRFVGEGFQAAVEQESRGLATASVTREQD